VAAALNSHSISSVNAAISLRRAELHNVFHQIQMRVYVEKSRPVCWQEATYRLGMI
jgi:hypothetical protein